VIPHGSGHANGCRIAVARAVFALTCFAAAVAFQGGPRSALGAGELDVAVAGGVRAADYPEIEATLSVIDAVTGRPLQDLTAEGVRISDDAGRARMVSITPSTATPVATGYVLLVDTSALMARTQADGKPYIERAAEALEQFRAGMGREDMARVVAFNNGVESRTNWVGREDPNLVAAIRSLTVSAEPSLLSPALVEAAAIANNPPPGVRSRAVVVVTAIEGKGNEPDLTLGTIKAQLTSTYFTVGVGTAGPGDVRLTEFFDDLAKYTGGGYWAINGPPSPAEQMQRLFGIMRKTWTVRFIADGLPDGKSHRFTVAVESNGRTGEGSQSYEAGALMQVSPVVFRNIAAGEKIGSDRDIEVAVGGTRPWTSTGVELFLDCEPGRCQPVATAKDRSVQWKLVAGPLDQGDHRLVARLTASDGQREYTDTASLTFVRGGTTFNLGILFLFGGVALVATGATAIAVTRRGAVRSRG